MNFLYKPKSFYFTLVAPLVVLLFLFCQIYFQNDFIVGQSTKMNWQFVLYFLGVSAISFAALIYYFSLQAKQHIGFTIVLFILLSLLLILYIFYENSLFTWEMKRFYKDTEIFQYPYTLLMPGIIHTFCLCVYETTKYDLFDRPVQNILISIIMPIAFFVFIGAIIPMWNGISGSYGNDYLYTFSGVILFMLFTFFIVRAGLLYFSKSWVGNIGFEVTFTLLFPIIGLIINDIAGNYTGNFTNILFYICTILTSFSIMIKHSFSQRGNIFAILLRVIMYPFSIYFFVVFLPYIPFGFALIILIGVGLLILSPSVLFLLHSHQLVQDYVYLKAIGYSQKKICAFTSTVLIIPAFIVLTTYIDKANFEQLLTYTFESNKINNSIDIGRARRTYDLLQTKIQRGRMMDENGTTPFLTSFYKNTIFNHQNLSREKKSTICNILYGKELGAKEASSQIKRAYLKNSASNTTYNAAEDYYTSEINFNLKSDNSWQSEFITSFSLPDGAYISDYYLYVGKEKKKGILAEKKAATWIYDNITAKMKDPGILYYEGRNRVVFKVFPFQQDEERKSGFTIIHKEPFTFEMDSQKLFLTANLNPKPAKLISSNGSFYLSTAYKKTLPKVSRKPYPYYIIDASEFSNSDLEEKIKEVKAFNTKNGFNEDEAKVCFSSFQSLHFNNFSSIMLNDVNKSGGFYLEKSIKEILNLAQNNPANNYYPIIIVFSGNFEKAIINKDFSEYKSSFPENDNFYTVDNSGIIGRHSLLNEPLKMLDVVTAISKKNLVHLLEINGKFTAFVDTTLAPSIVHTQLENQTSTKAFSKNKWQNGLVLDRSVATLHSTYKNHNAQWLGIVKNSFEQGILTPYTSYIVVETKEQEKLLKQKQEEMLKGNKNLDPKNFENMDEPSFYILILFILLLYFFKREGRKNIKLGF